MKPDDVVAALKALGVDISRKTLYNWEQWGLVPPANFRNSRNADYPVNVVEQAYASASLLSGIDILGQKLKMPVGLTRLIREMYNLSEPARKLANEEDFDFGKYEFAAKRIIKERIELENGNMDYETVGDVFWFVEKYDSKIEEARKKQKEDMSFLD